MELQLNEHVVYRNIGVCQIIAIEDQCMDGVTTISYYKLKPIADTNSTYYIPVAKADEKLRKLLTKEEVTELIDTMPLEEETDTVLSNNRRERREMYSQILKSDDHMAILRLISALYFHKRSSEAKGKRFSAMDENAMKNAETLMLQEFGFVLDLTETELRQYIDDTVNNRK